MGAAKDFFVKYIKSGYTGAFDPELDAVRSEYPPLVTSGHHNWGASVDKTSLLVIPSSKVFHLRQVLINNESDEGQYVYFYDGPGTSVSVGGLHVNRSTTLLEGDLIGMIFQSAVHASLATSNCDIRVAGLIRTST